MRAYSSLKQTIKSWLSRSPHLFDLVCRTIGKPDIERQLLTSILNRGDTAFDIGSNTGQYISLLTRLVGRTGFVHAFEPIPPTFSKLEKNVALQELPGHIYLNMIGLGDQMGLATMYVPNEHYTEGSLRTHHGDGAWVSVQGNLKPELSTYTGIRVNTLDHYVETHKVGEIALIKCDVEGAELLVLKGGAKCLRRTVPMLLLECYEPWTKDFGYMARDLFEFLEQLADYSFWHIGQKGMQKIEPNEDPFPGRFPEYLNFFCAVPTVHRKRLGSLTRIMSNRKYQGT